MKTLGKQTIKVFLALIVILVAGGAGGWLANNLFGISYNVKDVINQRLDSENDNAQVVIRGAKQVVVEQDTRSAEVIAGAERVVVGLFKKRADDNYDLLKEVAAGVIITNDGWLAANWQSKEGQFKPADYIVVTKDKKIYDLDRLVFDDFSGLTFIHLRNAGSLPVAAFKSSLSVSRGQTVFLAGWLKTVTSAVLLDNSRQDDVLSSDQPFKTLKLSSAANGEILAVDLSGQVVAWFNKDKQPQSVDYLVNAINALLANKTIGRAVLGVNYLNADYHLNRQEPLGAVIAKDKKGVAVVANSPAAKVGLRAGDIIYSVDDEELGYGLDLADIIATYQAGQKTVIKYWRGSEKKEAVVTL